MYRLFTRAVAAAAVTIATLAQPAAAAEPIRNAVDALRPSVNFRVIGGDVAIDRAWPWQVLVVILVRSADGKTAEYNCGGSVISPHWVLTAAHCVIDVDPKSRLMVVAEQKDGGTVKAMRLASRAAVRGNRLGVDVNADEKDLHVGVTPFVHPGYKPTSPTHENDIALLKLNEPVRSTSVKMLLHGDDALEGPQVRAVVTGWGRMREIDADGIDVLTGKKADPEEVEPKHLMEAKIPLVGMGKCKEAYKASPGVIDGRTLCAGLDEGGVDSCQGDSGGPLVTRDRSERWMQIGVVSWGDGCGRPGIPGIYTRVSAFAGWIRQNVGNDLADDDGPPIQEAQQPQQPEQPPQKPQRPQHPPQLPPSPQEAAVLDNPSGLTISFDKGDVVKVGQPVSYRVSANKPGFLAIFDLGPDNTLTQIFPNEKSLNSPTGRLPQALLLEPGQPRLIPEPNNPYAGFELEVAEPRGKGVMVAVLSEQRLTGLEIPKVAKTFDSRRQAVVSLAKLRNGLRGMRGLVPMPIEKQVADAEAAPPPGPSDGGGTFQKPTQQQMQQPVQQTSEEDATLPRWSIAVHEYQIR
jgi:secreted trypsin-like serine protease